MLRKLRLRQKTVLYKKGEFPNWLRSQVVSRSATREETCIQILLYWISISVLLAANWTCNKTS